LKADAIFVDNPPYDLMGSMSTATEHLYVTSANDILGGEPIIRGTRTPVRAIVELWRLGSQPEEICKHLPHLSLAQVFDALSYYSDHQEEINGHIQRNRVPEGRLR
jgi:uncharacterized protein (DUF433 family)